SLWCLNPSLPSFLLSDSCSQSSDMSAGSSPTSEDPYLCSICLTVFTDPVTTPCGHNFCLTCITLHWDGGHPYKCPMCNEDFTTRPQLRVNTLLRGMVDEFKHEAEQKAKLQAAKPGEVPCDICTGTRVKALKSCLMCLLSYCETHLEPHLTKRGLTRHQLVDPVENLEDRVCQTHIKPLELFCRTDQTCVCSLCPDLDHKTHECVPLMEECEGKKAELEKTEVEVQQMIQSRRLKIEEIKESNKAEDLIKDLEQEISELMKRSSEVKQLSSSKDHILLLQGFNSLKVCPLTRNWTNERVHLPSYEEAVLNAQEAELKWVQHFAVDVTLDSNTAHPNLVLSADGKQVYHSDVRKRLPNNRERFLKCLCVMGKESFSSGRFYFEVQVKGKTEWNVGVARRSINSNGAVLVKAHYDFWTFGVASGSLAPDLEKVGVFVDYKKGVVSFYDVKAAALLKSISGCFFSDQLYPLFYTGPNRKGTNSAPMVICPVVLSA
uniref:Tripartite motif containing 47 n=1 Tax=Nothobranchius furzeri TaxID=105023 RepID=A0A8C6KA67_NOTFU